jgi:alpha-D-ribose 1-methylphosphonate 5-triphosphate synthase subunit PhnL
MEMKPTDACTARGVLLFITLYMQEQFRLVHPDVRYQHVKAVQMSTINYMSQFLRVVHVTIGLSMTTVGCVPIVSFVLAITE